MNQNRAGHEAFRLRLTQEIARRRAKNPAYSLRAFARSVGLVPAELSTYLRLQRNFSAKKIRTIATRLGLDPRSIASYTEVPAVDTPLISTQRMELSVDHYRLISEWHHFAILSLSETQDFECDPEWIAGRLGLPVRTIKTAIERLLRLEMIEPLGKDASRFRASGKSYTSSDEVVNLSLRQSHLSNLELAQKSLQEDDIALRDFTSMTMAIDLAKLPEAKKRIRKFRDELSHFLETGKKTEVYKLNLNLIPLSRKTRTQSGAPV